MDCQYQPRLRRRYGASRPLPRAPGSPHRDRQRLFSRGGKTGLPAPFASFAPSHVRLRCVETGHFVDFRARLFRPRAANAVMSEQIEECGVSVTSWRDRHRAKFLHPRNTGQPGNACSFTRVPVHSRRYAQLLASVGLCGGVCGVRPGVGHLFSHPRSKAR